MLGLGCVLEQLVRIVAYGFRQLKDHEKNYLVHDLEHTAIIFTRKICCHNLFGEKFSVMTDHKSLIISSHKGI